MPLKGKLVNAECRMRNKLSLSHYGEPEEIKL